MNPPPNKTLVRFQGKVLSAAVRWICQQVKDSGGRALLVGGCVRDSLLGQASKDADIEIFGLTAEAVEALLRRRFKVSLVGRAFGVFKLSGLDLDVSLPRTESKSGAGHRGFAVTGDPNLSFRNAARRRDFTCNAIGWDPLTGECLDPFNGESDLRARVLRHVSEHFGEDPLRVLRAMQLAARFDLRPTPDTLALCRAIEPEGLPAERQFEEWRKLILRGVTPSRGLAFLKDCGWISHYPELEAMVGCPQDPRWHPEGDVWVHTLHCMDAFARERTGDDHDDLIVGLAVLCHDMGKPATTVRGPDGRIRSPRHDQVGATLASEFLDRLTRQKSIHNLVIPLVKAHMRPADFYHNRAGDGAIRRLAGQVDRLDLLVRVVRADSAGRPPIAPEYNCCDWLLQRAAALRVADEKPKPMILGRHLIAMGVTPGPHYKAILDRCFEAQLDGAFDTEPEAEDYLRQFMRDLAPDPGAAGNKNSTYPD